MQSSLQSPAGSTDGGHRSQAWKGQAAHAAGLLLLAAASEAAAAATAAPAAILRIAIASAALHQAVVALFWRSELFGGHISAQLGPRGFGAFGALFFILFALRVGVVLWASAAIPATLEAPSVLRYGTLAVAGALSLWTVVSVFTCFGVKRALGADHFFPEYRSMPLVRRGPFRITPNAMYTFGTLLFLLPGLLFDSTAGLAAGVIHYCAVWLHYLFTERPDFAAIYGHSPRESAAAYRAVGSAQGGVVLYTHSQCVRCPAAAELLEQLSVPHRRVMVDRLPPEERRSAKHLLTEGIAKQAPRYPSLLLPDGSLLRGFDEAEWRARLTQIGKPN